MKSKLIMTSLSAILGLYGLLILFLIIIFNIIGISINYLLITSIIVLIVQFLLAPFFMDLTMKWFYKVKYDKELPEYLKEFIDITCKNNKMKYPKIGFIDDGAPNAFTYGRTKNDARIILTRGILELLNEEEVKSVIAHEIGHAVHYDMFFMTAVQIVPLILYSIFDSLTNNVDDEDSGKLAIIGIIAYVLYIISEYVILWFSRTREYYADEFSLHATKNPNALSQALVKIGYGLTTNHNKDIKNTNVSSVSALGIFDSKASKSLVITSYDDGKVSSENIKKAARWELLNPWAKWYELNSTHPLISKRIKSICKYSSIYNQKEYIKFDEDKSESYVDDFIFEVFIKFLPITLLLILILVGVFYIDNSNKLPLYISLSFTAFSISLFIPYLRSHKNKDYKKSNVVDLLKEVKVSAVTSIPCIVEGEIIGKGTPGYMFSEDFIIKDDSGIIFLDYKQPLAIFNMLFALLKSKEYINKKVEVKGWYRRSPVPYIEIKSITLDGKVKKCHTFTFTLVMFSIFTLIGIIFSILLYSGYLVI